MKLHRIALSALVLLASACASAPEGNDPATPPRSPRGALTYDQLAGTQQSTLYDAIQRLQPSWLRQPSRGWDANVGVFLNGAHVGGLEFLRQFPATQAQEVRYLTSNAVEAELTAHQARGLGAAIMISGRRAERNTTP
jgi:hypothetical protein